MEAAAVGTAVGKLAPKLYDLLLANRRVRADLEHDIESIKKELLMISAVIRQDGGRRRGGDDDVHGRWIAMVRELAREIEDCVDSFTHRVALASGTSWIRRKLHRVKTVRARNQFAAAIRRLKKKSAEAAMLRNKYEPDASSVPTTNFHTGNTGSSCNLVPDDDEDTETDTVAVGIDAQRDELLEMIRGQQPEDLKVISLVGFGGIGKTLLARQAYDDTVEEGEYHVRAWVRAADKRFFIVIDDIRAAFWHDIKDAFPVVPGVSSIVMVTTAIQSIANACSTTHGHVYVMKTLAEEHSRQLFLKEAFLEDAPAPGDRLQLSTSQALTKCDGLPLALVTTAQFLQSRGNPERWGNLCKYLGKHLETENTLARMKRVLVHSYTSLGSEDVKTCLLYLSIYSSGHPIRRGILIRRLLAEGLINEDNRRSALSVAIDCFNELVNRSIIQPIHASGAEVKKCQTHGMMLEFILHKSMCEDFVTSLYHKDPLPGSNIRWLSLHNKTVERSKMNPKSLRLVRSLTVFGKAHKSVLDFSMYKLLRVLDLEECNEHLDDKHLKEICNLLLLRYLSLGGAVMVTVLPKEVKKLQFLETLDIRKTKIEILPAQVMELPCLVHLFGKFKLQHNVGDRRMGKLKTWLSENSKLETLSGFVVDKSQELPQLMDHMEYLTKVKVWCESTGTNAFANNNLSHLSKAIKGFIQRGTQPNEARSLSLNINDEWSQDFLDFSMDRDNSYYLSSLKLRGNRICSQLPLFVIMLGGLTKLCLSFPDDYKLSGNFLDSLSRVSGLEYLKLIATQLDKLVIGQGALRSLQRLCVMVEVMTELEIQEGAMPRVEALQLLCKNMNGFSGTTIQCLPRLKEVALHDGLSNQTKQDWKEAAKRHPRYPKLLFVTREMVNEPTAKFTPAATITDMMAQEVHVGSKLAGNFDSPVIPPTATTLSMTTPPGAISNGESVPIATSELKSEPAVEIPMAPAATTNMTLPVNHDASANAQQEYSVQVVTSEMGSVMAAKIHVAPVTTDNATFSVNHDAFANAQQECCPINNMESFKKKT
ncbi:unnamed protein product [Triticum turgidum subsp. durum]|uniref:Uncharacterized protein n=1 Tax=Triticum turgidum subsp. durum TaxID=4567 RepID=A0A9R0Z1L1_TRITD|nr:unnamed protein product [Triticum turgidum subsp. durum]